MANVNLEELFGTNFSAADALAATKTEKSTGSSRNPNIYKPSINDENCKDMNYRAIGRFIPFLYNGKWRTTVCRWECFLKDVNGENGMFVVSPKTDGKRCPIRTLSYNLYKSENAIDRENSKKLQVYQQYYALFEVINDVQHPEYNGKVLIYQFGSKIYEKLEAVMNSTELVAGSNPFGLYDAKLFEINLKKDSTKKMGNGKPVTDYEKCRFVDQTGPIHFGDGKTLTSDTESWSEYYNWLENDAPKITDYLWKEWTSEFTEKVNSLLATYTSDYSAPRSTVASAAEAINIVSGDPTPNIETSVETSSSSFEVDDDDEETTVSDNDDDMAWLKNVIPD